MFRISLLDFFTRILTSRAEGMDVAGGEYTLDWVDWMVVITGDSSHVDLGFMFRRGGGYRAFTATFELDLELRQTFFADERLVELVESIAELKSVSNRAEMPNHYMSFPYLGELLRYGLGGITMIITPFEKPIVRSGGY